MTGRRARRSAASRKSATGAEGSSPPEIPEEQQTPTKKGEVVAPEVGVAPRRSTRSRKGVPPSRSTSPTTRTASQRKRRRSFQSNNRDTENDTNEENSGDEGYHQDSNSKASSAAPEPQDKAASERVSPASRKRPTKMLKQESTSDDEVAAEVDDPVEDSATSSAEETNGPLKDARVGAEGEDSDEKPQTTESITKFEDSATGCAEETNGPLKDAREGAAGEDNEEKRQTTGSITKFEDSATGSSEETNGPLIDSREGAAGVDNKEEQPPTTESTPEAPQQSSSSPKLCGADQEEAVEEHPLDEEAVEEQLMDDEAVEEQPIDEEMKQPTAESPSPSNNALMTLMDAIYLKEQSESKENNAVDESDPSLANNEAPVVANNDEHASKEIAESDHSEESKEATSDGIPVQPIPKTNETAHLELNGDAKGNNIAVETTEASIERDDVSTTHLELNGDAKGNNIAVETTEASIEREDVSTNESENGQDLNEGETPQPSKDQDAAKEQNATDIQEEIVVNEGENEREHGESENDATPPPGHEVKTITTVKTHSVDEHLDQSNAELSLLEGPNVNSEHTTEQEQLQDKAEQNESKQDDEADNSGLSQPSAHPLAQQTDTDITSAADQPDEADLDTVGVKSENEKLDSPPMSADAEPSSPGGAEISADHDTMTSASIESSNLEQPQAPKAETPGDERNDSMNLGDNESIDKNLSTIVKVVTAFSEDLMAAVKMEVIGHDSQDHAAMPMAESMDCEPSASDKNEVDSSTDGDPNKAIETTEASDVDEESNIAEANHIKDSCVQPSETQNLELPSDVCDDSVLLKETADSSNAVNVIDSRPTFDQIKARLYFIGCNTHRGSGSERIFANYWSSLTLFLSSKPSVVTTRKCQEAFGAFLTTRKLRRLHNILIFSLLRKTLQPVQMNSQGKTSKDLKVQRAKAKSSSCRGATSQDYLDAPLKKDIGLLHLIDPIQLESPYAPLIEDDTVTHMPSQLSDQVDYPESASLPGALVVDPFAREMVQREGMRTNEATVWLLTVAVQEYVKSILTSVITAKDSISQKLVLAHDHGIVEDAANALSFTLPPSERKRVSIIDMGCLMAGYPSRKSDAYNGRISRTASERCLHSLFKSNPFSYGEAFDRVRKYVASDIMSVASAKRRRVEIKEQTLVVPSTSTHVIEAEPMPSDRKEPEAKETRIRSPVVGLGRGAKDLAALKARAATAAKSSATEDQVADGNNDSTETPSAASTPIRGNRSIHGSRKDVDDNDSDAREVPSKSVAETSGETQDVAPAVNVATVDPSSASVVDLVQPIPNTDSAPASKDIIATAPSTVSVVGAFSSTGVVVDAEPPAADVVDAEPPAADVVDAEPPSASHVDAKPPSASHVDATHSEQKSANEAPVKSSLSTDLEKHGVEKQSTNESEEPSTATPLQPVVKARRGKGFGIKNLAAMRARTLTKEEADFDNERSSQSPHGSPKPESFEGQYSAGVAASSMTPIKTSGRDDEEWISNETLEEPQVKEQQVTEQQVEEPQVKEVTEPQVEEPQVKEPQIEESQVELQVKEPQVEEPQVEEPQVEEPQIEEPQVTDPQSLTHEIQEEKNEDGTASDALAASIIGKVDLLSNLEPDQLEKEVDITADPEKEKILQTEVVEPKAIESSQANDIKRDTSQTATVTENQTIQQTTTGEETMEKDQSAVSNEAAKTVLSDPVEVAASADNSG